MSFVNETEEGGQSQNTGPTSRSDMNSNTMGGGNAPAKKAAPVKPAGGTLLCLIGTHGNTQYYIYTGAPGHCVNEIKDLHNYVPFEVLRTVTKVKNGTVQPMALGR
jgi:hypothetical protein